MGNQRNPRNGIMEEFVGVKALAPCLPPLQGLAVSVSITMVFFPHMDLIHTLPSPTHPQAGV